MWHLVIYATFKDIDMKANEFVREHGLEKARELVKTSPLDKREKPKDMMYIPNDTFVYKSTPLDICVDVIKLKSLIESHDLLDEIDGVDGARDRIYLCEIDGCTSFSLGGYVYEVSQVKQAIADVESCNEISLIFTN